MLWHQQKTPTNQMVRIAVRNTIPKALCLKAVPHQKISLKGSALIHHQPRLPQRRRRLPPFQTRHQAQQDRTIGYTHALCQSAHFTAVTFVGICKFMGEK